MGSHAEVLVGPEPFVVNYADAPLGVADVEREPDFLEDQRCGGGKEKPLIREAGDDLVDGRLAIDDHAQPAEAGHVADEVRDADEGPHARVADAEVAVAAKDKDFCRLRGTGLGLITDHGGEAGIDEFVEVDGDRVEGDEIFDLEVPR